MKTSTYKTVCFRCPEHLLDLIQENPETKNMALSRVVRFAMSKLFNVPEPVRNSRTKLQWTAYNK